MRPSEYIERQREYEYFSRTIQIGIYGYYDPLNRIELKKLKHFLFERGLNAKMAEDIDSDQYPVISYATYAISTSQILFQTSKIHIYIATPKIEAEKNKLLDSLSMEYGWSWIPKQKYVGVYFKRSFDVSTLPLGATQIMDDQWSHESFDNITEIFLIVLRYCESAIREMYVLSDDA
jgi:hypothetical protein